MFLIDKYFLISNIILVHIQRNLHQNSAMDSQSQSSGLLRQKQPNGSAYPGSDNPAFVADSQTDRFTRRTMRESRLGLSGLYQSPVDSDFEERRHGTDSEDSDDSNRSQHEGQDVENGSVGMDSRLDDFEGEMDAEYVLVFIILLMEVVVVTFISWYW